MNIQINLRPALAGSMASALVLLAACGGGGETTLSQASPSGTAALSESALALVPGDTRVKWNPGHYVQLGAGAADALVQRTFKEISTLPNVRGVQTRYFWRDLEPTEGVYDFSEIDKDLAQAQAVGKRLFIVIGTKAFSAGARALPDYMHTDEYDGGAFRIQINAKDTVRTEATTGENIALFNGNVRDRFIALTTALGQRYNSHNTFEGIGFNETALGQAVVPLTNTQKADFFTNLAAVDAATRQAFPNTVVMQFINYPRPYMPALVSSAISNSVALGGPDTFLDDSELDASAYIHYDAAWGKVPLGPSVQAENYVTTYQGGPYAPPAVTDLYAFAKGRLHANYIFWAKTLTEPLVPYSNVLAMWKSSSFPKDAAGGLSTACPSTFASCVPKL
ncbi:beta-galactosidase [uncultured Azohydromonas sp.]|uniref:beta-galactosidase n=1 Tax=uncultured Azohydromonas sp. TaxID=487342 RepID=UPI002604EE56|nr:beta-galactosidase [uncultured Azohydromonas sp.]